MPDAEAIRRWLPALLCAALVLGACNDSGHADAGKEAEVLLGRDDALAIAREKAAAEGFDLANYRLDKFAGVRDEAAPEWSFVFICAPGPPPPGCHFSVAVDRRSGVATLYRGY